MARFLNMDAIIVFIFMAKGKLSKDGRARWRLVTKVAGHDKSKCLG